MLQQGQSEIAVTGVADLAGPADDARTCSDSPDRI